MCVDCLETLVSGSKVYITYDYYKYPSITNTIVGYIGQIRYLAEIVLLDNSGLNFGSYMPRENSDRVPGSRNAFPVMFLMIASRGSPLGMVKTPITIDFAPRSADLALDSL